MTVQALDKRRKRCPYCNLVPASEHPEYSCPRISSISMEADGSTTVEFVDPEKWAILSKALVASE